MASVNIDENSEAGEALITPRDSDSDESSSYLESSQCHPSKWVIFDRRYRFTFVIFLVWVCSGLYMYTCLPWGADKHYYTIAESLYMMVQILTTIGYGDHTPSTTNGFLLTSMYVLVGIFSCSGLVSVMVDRIIKMNEDFVLTRKSEDAGCPDLIKRPSWISERGWEDLKAALKAFAAWGACVLIGMLFYSNYCEKSVCVSGHCCGIWAAEPDESCSAILPLGCKNKYKYRGSIHHHCTNTSGKWWCSTTDEYQEDSEEGIGWLTCQDPYWAQENSFKYMWHPTWPNSCNTSSCEDVDDPCSQTRATCCEAKTYLKSFYMGVITLTTVGFGDVIPVTHGGMWFSIVWMLIGVAMFANLLAKLTSLQMQSKKAEHLTSKFLRTMMKSEYIQKCMSEHGPGQREQIMRAEFVLHALMDDGLVSADVLKQLNLNFDMLDTDKSGSLSRDDLEAIDE